MQISPLEIRNHPFRKVTFGGLDAEQVQSFLTQIATEVEDMRRENDAQSAQLKALESEVSRCRKIEDTLTETLISAQRATDEARVSAQREAELILKDAKVRADRIEHEMRERLFQLDADFRSLDAQKEQFLTRFRSLLRDQLTFVEVMAEKMESEENPVG